MAGINIGTVVFGIEANTDQLRKAFGDITKLRNQVTRLAQAQTKGAKLTEAALARQSNATRTAMRQFVELRNKLNKAGAPAKQIEQLEDAFARLTLELTSGKISVTDYGRAMQTFKDKMSKTNKELDDFKNGLSVDGKGQDFATTMRNMESAAVLAIGPLSGVGARIRSIGAIAGRSQPHVIAMVVGFTALAVAVGKLSSSALRAAVTFEASMARFVAASGSVSIARKEMGFVVQTSLQLGLRIEDTAKAFSRLAASAAGTSLAGKGARDVFLAVAKASAALRLSNQEVEGTFRAIEQMMSKGTVQAEELRGQLGERLPGAFRLAAKAMGHTTQEMGKLLKLGEITAEEFLPKLAAELEKTFGEAAKANLDSYTGAMSNLSNRALLFSKEFDRISGTSKIVVGGLKAAAAALKFLREQLVNIVSVIGAVGVGLAILSHVAIWKGIKAIAGAIRLAAIATWAWNVALLANPLIAVTRATLTFVAAVVGGIAAFFGFNFLMDEGKKSLEEMNTEFDEMAKKMFAVASQSNKFQALARGIKDAQQATELLELVLRDIGDAGVENVEALTKRHELGLKVLGMSRKELNALLGELIKAGSGPITENINHIADAWFNVVDAEREAEENLQNFIRGVGVLKGVEQTIKDLNARLVALKEGSEAVEFFDLVTVASNKVREAFKGTNIEIEVQEEVIARLATGLVMVSQAEIKLADATTARTKAQKDSKKAGEDLQKGIFDAFAVMDALRTKIGEFEKGPGSFEVFEKVTVHVEKFKKTLADLGMHMGSVNAIGAIYERLLMRWLELTGQNATANKKMGEGIKSAVLTIGKLSKRLEALRAGPGSLEVFTQITVKVDKMRESLVKMKAPLIVVTVLTALYTRVLTAMLDITGSVAKASEKMDEKIAATALTVEDLKARLEAIQKGSKALAIFDNITMKSLELTRAFESLGDITPEIRKLIEDLTAAMAANATAMAIMTAAEAAAEAQRKKTKKAAEDWKKTLEDTRIELDQMRLRLAALASGPESFEVFTNVTEKVNALRLSLQGEGRDLEVINKLVAEYQELLERQQELTGLTSRRANQASQAITNSLEEILVMGGSVTDMLHDLAKELLRVALRAMFLDKLQTSLGTFFGGFGATPAASGGAVHSGGSFSSRGGSHGGSFTIGGSGGVDKPVTFLGKPGEIVEVRRRDQPGGIGGGGASVVINQTNNFEGGGLADPAILFPLIEENNRKLKGEIMEGMARGTFG